MPEERDIGAELYELIRTDFERFLDEESPELPDINSANMKQADSYAHTVGRCLARAIAKHVKPEVLPDGRLYYNIAEKILDPTLRENHRLVNEFCGEIQKLINERQGINIRPQAAKYPEERAHALINAAAHEEDWDKTERILDDSVRTLTDSFYADNVKANADFRSKAGLRVEIVREGGSKCCPWCAELVGRYAYPDEVPKDVYRRHDNCTCSVTYVNSRARQNVWSKQYWSAEHEQKYLELRDELKAKKMTAAPDVKKPVRLSKKEVQAILNKVRGLTFGENGGRINTEKAFRKEGDDPMFEVTGRAIDSNPREIEEMEKRLKEWGVEINRGQNTLAYGSPANGRPGTMSITDDASFSAWKHEFKHAEDDKNAGWNAVYVLWNDPAEHERRERRAYEEEIKLAREAGREDIAKRLEANRDAEIERIWKAYRKYHGDT